MAAKMWNGTTPVVLFTRKITATVVLNQRIPLNYFDEIAHQCIYNLFGSFGLNISLSLVSADKTEDTGEAKVSNPTYLETSNAKPLLGDSSFAVEFDWDEDFGTPGALLVRNIHITEIYLKTITLEDVPGHGRITFICNSWVYNTVKYPTARIFFANKTYLPNQMPKPLRRYREEELKLLRGNGKGELQEWDRVYDYAVYNDLGNPDAGPQYKRQTLGGNADFPYPRRGRTSRPPTTNYPTCESRLPMVKGLSIYVPRDEKFNFIKMKDFLADAVKAMPQNILPVIDLLTGDKEFTSFDEVMRLYGGPLIQLIPSGFKYPMPQVIQSIEYNDREAWRSDEEFAREMLAGVNPIVIRRLEEFPPKSKLDPAIYGNQNSLIRRKHIKGNLDGYTVEQALTENRLFILDHHDPLMPYLRRINTTTTKTYASRTLLFLKDDGTLKPLVIELSYPHPEADIYGCVGEVYTPGGETIVERRIWELAKAYVAVNDSGYHQLISHWLNTHAVIEPFVIATNRQLSVVHPIHKLLKPHFRDTMFINALARQTLINAGGVLERTVYPSKYAMEMSAVVYKGWNFIDQALPIDLKKRGIAIDDKNSPHGLSLLIKDYPYAVDGLEIWFAIEEWVKNYCSFYYENDTMVQEDEELQVWWKELREEGHGDKKYEEWWPKMQTLQDLIDSCIIIIWVASALHAAVNFSQYPYAGYLPNRPTISRRFMPKKGSPEYDELQSNPEKVFLSIITSMKNTLIGVSLIEILSKHSTDEVYLGDRSDPDLWTTDAKPLNDFYDFGNKLREIEDKINRMNRDKTLRNRSGPIHVPFTQLVPSSKPGVTGMGIPNSVSI